MFRLTCIKSFPVGVTFPLDSAIRLCNFIRRRRSSTIGVPEFSPKRAFEVWVGHDILARFDLPEARFLDREVNQLSEIATHQDFVCDCVTKVLQLSAGNLKTKFWSIHSLGNRNRVSRVLRSTGKNCDAPPLVRLRRPYRRRYPPFNK